MKARELAVPGAWEITPQIHTDTRGLFFEWFTDTAFADFAGHRLDLHQANCSVSAAGVLRGLHFAQLPPSQAKYVTCLNGAVFDVVVDIRTGSPTFGTWDAVVLDDPDAPERLPLRRAGPRLPRPRRQLHSDVPVLSGLRPRPRAHHQRPRPRTEHRLAHHPRPTQPVRARPPGPHPRPSPSRRPATDMGRHPRLRRRPTPRLPLNLAVKLSILHSGS